MSVDCFLFSFADGLTRGQIIGPKLFEPTLQQTDLSTDRMVFGPIHGC
jgi:hypothetical protein